MCPHQALAASLSRKVSSGYIFVLPLSLESAGALGTDGIESSRKNMGHRVAVVSLHHPVIQLAINNFPINETPFISLYLESNLKTVGVNFIHTFLPIC